MTTVQGLNLTSAVRWSIYNPFIHLTAVADPVLDLLAMAAIFPSVISSFFTQNKGGPGPPGPPP